MVDIFPLNNLNKGMNKETEFLKEGISELNGFIEELNVLAKLAR
jgi:hypothetical protein